MAPLKFDEHIKEQLESREITPSKEAWDTLVKRLETEESPKRKGFFWYSIAASIIGLLMISFFYFNTKKDGIPAEIQTVDTPVKQEKIKENIKPGGLPAKIQETERVTVKENPVAPQVKKQVSQPAEDKNLPGFDVEIAVVANQGTEMKHNNPPTAVFKDEEEQAIQNKIAEVIAQVQELEHGDSLVTDAEVDAILRRAQQELLNDKIFKPNNRVDAMALLAEAEGELDKTFRDQLFDALKNGYLKVRTAVADRNN